jgi:hypothetical protein
LALHAQEDEMKFNVSFMGPEQFGNLRRDLMLLLRYSLEDLGHKVMLSMNRVEVGWTNILIGTYFRPASDFKAIMDSGADIIHLNSEVISKDMLNFNPKKVDFLGAYLPFLRTGRGILEMVVDNMPEHQRYGTHAVFLRWAYHEKLEDLRHFAPQDRDLDFYIFGMMSERRKAFVAALQKAGFRGIAHHTCPFWERNSTIERAKINLNIIQEEIYTHVNCFRIGYLANNRCAILSEQEHDPAGYLNDVKITTRETFLNDFASLMEGNRYLQLEKETYYSYRKTHMTHIMESALEDLFTIPCRRDDIL